MKLLNFVSAGAVSLIAILGSTVAFAAEAEAHSGGGDAYASLGAAIAIAVAAFGGALGQGKVAAAALDGIARNPASSGKLFVPMILGLVFIESLVLYAFVIGFLKIKI